MFWVLSANHSSEMPEAVDFKWWIIVSVWLFSHFFLSQIVLVIRAHTVPHTHTHTILERWKALLSFVSVGKYANTTQYLARGFCLPTDNFRILFKIIYNFLQWISNNKIKKPKPASHTGSTLRTSAIKMERRLFNNSSPINIHHLKAASYRSLHGNGTR